MQVTVKLDATDLGATPGGIRNEVAFAGTATSPHWPGEWPVVGIDHLVVGSDGIAHLDVHAVVGSGTDVFAYRGRGRARPEGIIEGIVFETSSERLSWLNGAVAIAVGNLRNGALVLELFQVVQDGSAHS